jgi:hypothetical protein
MNQYLKIIIIILGVFLLSALASYSFTHTRQAPAVVTLTPNETVKEATTTPALQPGFTNKVNLYYIALEDNGVKGKKIGCNDSVVAVSKTVAPTQGPLRVALESLLAEKSQQVGGYYNVLAQSNLKLVGLSLTDGVATVRLEGQLSSGGVCDDPRIDAQLKETALQFPSVKKVVLYHNGKILNFSQQ